MRCAAVGDVVRIKNDVGTEIAINAVYGTRARVTLIALIALVAFVALWECQV
jgi:hypothetical protein